MNTPLTEGIKKLDTAPVVERNGCYYVEFNGKSYGSFPTRIGAESWWEAQKEGLDD